jgi:ribonuclease-3
MDKKRKEDLTNLCKSLDIKMHDLELMNTALTHTSYAYESKKRPHPEHNERLEFLGDSVLSLVVSTYIYDKYTKKDEGYLSKLRAFLVCETTLAVFAKKMKLGDYLLLGNGELNVSGRERPSILADAFESVVGAYYLDHGLEEVKKFLYDIILKHIDALAKEGIDMDYKTRLQEEVQKNGVVDIEYDQLEAIGPAHERIFTMRVMVNRKERGRGSGRTKKEAEQQAAKVALADLL